LSFYLNVKTLLKIVAFSAGYGNQVFTTGLDFNESYFISLRLVFTLFTTMYKLLMSTLLKVGHKRPFFATVNVAVQFIFSVLQVAAVFGAD